MSTSTTAIINNSNLLNQEITAKCQKAEETIKDMTITYKQPINSDHRFVVSFVGKFKTGKSSLINTLIGNDILPTKATTATSVVTRIFYGSKPKCRLRTDTEDKKISIDEGKNIILNHKVTDVDKTTEVIFELPIPWIKYNIELRDTPGMDDSSQDGKLETITLNALKDTDLCICVYDSCTMISEKERARTQAIHKMMSGNVVYAVNCTNRLNSIESINQVEKLAKNFFGTMNYSIPGMGKYYMMCSAPKMVELDGFDKWIQNFVSRNNLQVLNQVRNSTGKGQVSVFKSNFSKDSQQYIEQIEQQIATLKEKHEEIISQKKEKAINVAQNEEEAFKNTVKNLTKEVVDISSGLIEIIKECKNKGSDYETNTKIETMNYFIDRYNASISNYNNYFSLLNDVQFIEKAFTGVTFPGEHKKTIKATGGEIAGWAGAGSVLGFLVGGPVGAAVGAALGGGIGSSSTTSDDSVNNTMNYIKKTIVPLVQKAINNRIAVISRNIKNKGNKKFNSGLETVLSQTRDVQKMLRKYDTTD
ncbi:MAG: dynamin family protein [Candidatus Gastranaerophilaceae bacterium]